jgi:hypothetical protein
MIIFNNHANIKDNKNCAKAKIDISDMGINGIIAILSVGNH